LTRSGRTLPTEAESALSCLSGLIFQALIIQGFFIVRPAGRTIKKPMPRNIP